MSNAEGQQGEQVEVLLPFQLVQSSDAQGINVTNKFFADAISKYTGSPSKESTQVYRDRPESGRTKKGRHPKSSLYKNVKRNSSFEQPQQTRSPRKRKGAGGYSYVGNQLLLCPSAEGKKIFRNRIAAEVIRNSAGCSFEQDIQPKTLKKPIQSPRRKSSMNDSGSGIRLSESWQANTFKWPDKDPQKRRTKLLGLPIPYGSPTSQASTTVSPLKIPSGKVFTFQSMSSMSEMQTTARLPPLDSPTKSQASSPSHAAGSEAQLHEPLTGIYQKDFPMPVNAKGQIVTYMDLLREARDHYRAQRLREQEENMIMYNHMVKVERSIRTHESSKRSPSPASTLAKRYMQWKEKDSEEGSTEVPQRKKDSVCMLNEMETLTPLYLEHHKRLLADRAKPLVVPKKRNDSKSKAPLRRASPTPKAVPIAMPEQEVAPNEAAPAEGETPPAQDEVALNGAAPEAGEGTSAQPEATPASQGAPEAAPAQEEAAPAQEEAAPAQEEAAPAQEEAAPAQEEAAPAQEEAALAQEEAAPAQEEATPAQEEAAPAQEEAALAQEEVTPAQEEATPAQEEAAPTQAEIAPEATQAQEEAAPAQEEAAPAQEEANPETTAVQEESAPAQEEASLAQEEAAQTQEEAAQTQEEAAPAQREAAPEAAPSQEEAIPEAAPAPTPEAAPGHEDAAPEATLAQEEAALAPAPEAAPEAAQAQEEVTPAQEEVTPAQEEVTPAQEEVTPTQEEVTPAQEEAAPAQAEVAPEATQAQEEAAPEQQEAAPAQEEAAP